MADVEAHFRSPELADFLAWLRQGRERTFTWGGARWERPLTPRQRLAMAVCEDLGLKVLRQNPATGTQQRRVYRFQTRLPETVLECARAQGLALADASVLAGDDYGLYAVAFTATGDAATLDALEADWGLVARGITGDVPVPVPGSRPRAVS